MSCRYNIHCLLASFFFLLTCSFPLWNQVPQSGRKVLPLKKQQIRFHHLGIEDGLSQSTISSIQQDKNGFMWFGTQDGMNRYDGYNFLIYRDDPVSSFQLKDDNILSSLVDSRGNLWLGGRDGSLSLYNKSSQTFSHFLMDPGSSTGARQFRAINCIFENSGGDILLGTNHGVFFLDQDNRTAQPYLKKFPQSGWIQSGTVTVIFEDEDFSLWIGTDSGLIHTDRESKNIITYLHRSGSEHSISDNKITGVMKDSFGLLWVGTSNGLNRYDQKNDNFISYTPHPSDSHSLSHEWVTVIFEDRRGILWIGTRNGLNRFDRYSDSFITYHHDPIDSFGLSSDYITSLYEDNSGVIWVGTYDAGLSLFEGDAKKFISYTHNPNDPNTISNNSVSALHVDKRGVIWIGTNGGGLDRFDRVNNRIIHYQRELGNPASLSYNYIRSISEDRQGDIWVGTDGGGLNRFIPSQNRFIHYRHDPEDVGSISSDSIRRILPDREGNLWIATDGGGINKFDRRRNSFLHFQMDPDDPKSLNSNTVYSLIQDKQGYIWIGTFGKGVNRFNPKDGKMQSFQHISGDISSISNNYILSMLETGNGDIWIGTDWGLNKYDPDTGRFIHYTEREGLPSSVAYGILEDDKGHLWISSNNGLSEFDPVTEVFKNYDMTDGILSNEFWGGSCFKSESGEMFFGSIKGLNAFFPDEIQDSTYVPPVVITDLKIFNQSVLVGERIGGKVLLNRSITETESIRLSYKLRLVSFNFSALHFASPDKNMYAYKMDGLDEKWHHIGNRNFIDFTTLPSGKYTLNIKGSNSDNVWNNKGVSLNIVVLPPFWNTWWFIGILLVFGFGLSYSIHRNRVKVIKKQKIHLENVVEDRTAELELINRELKNFAYIVSHDLKAPLRAISQLATWLGEDYTEKLDAKGKEQVKLMVGRAKRMNSLIEGILEYSRVGRIQEHEEDINLNDLIRDVVEFISPPDSITVTIENELPVLKGEVVRFEQLFQNLIGNAIKYMDKPKGFIHVGSRETDGLWTFWVRDNGPGIAEKYHEKVFQIFQTLMPRDEVEGTGVGLTVVKKIVELYGGRIWLESDVGEGTTFYFTISKTLRRTI